ncbi:DegT/DnrJ/EryC1/StrS family aminotransferase [Vibrio aestuarianus]|uniref:DegT/DnrJ/EryC1/StrS family aminotransferase n=3 Tax=Vibrio TaxID=662 RepID=UPI00237D2F14|nr:DegT/DnrJ/EryC1/StrS family aminotransferase [Vibrio aestuarianus]MDE1210223.1 DegT/DnrJ/EryC1/StrS family aminotransferase [Vibrio aestuarianus]MDE1251606.1 DegT/DnrJ/EryC1/StrS family aminotransferase [Vibrio aestuarianus]MDE1338759.1 DegT/DnrJ/EryC1/StrS family aminotransferase [Vibrio aestuarianus]
MINLNQPIKPDLERLTKYLLQVNESGWYTNFGPLHQQLTQRLENYLGVENLLLVSNGTLALQVAYKTLNVKKAVTTPFSFVATASSLIWEDIETFFCDIDRESYNLSPEKVQQALDDNSEIDTVVATHVYGNPCNVNHFERLSQKNNVKIIYDAAHAFGINVGSASVLNFGDASTLSFHATKLFHTVEGGAIVFKHKADFERAKRLINFGMDKSSNISEAGINAKLNEYQCAVGLTNLDIVDEIIKHRVNLYEIYRVGLKGLVKIQAWSESSSKNGAYMAIDVQTEENVQELTQLLSESNIQSRRYFTPSLEQVFANQFSFGCERSAELTKGIMCLPLHFYMSSEDVYRVIDVIKRWLK